MSEANFEKNVQQEMLGFKVKPSEEVWIKVEERIRKKKRRRIFFILFFAGLALVGYWQRDLLFSEKETSIQETVSLPQEKFTIVDSIKTIIPEKINDKVFVKENPEKNKKVVINNQQQSDQVKEKIISENSRKRISKTSNVVVTNKKEISEKSKTVEAKPITELPNETQVSKNNSVVNITTENTIKDSVEASVVNVEGITQKAFEKIDEKKMDIDSIQKEESKTDSLVDKKKLPAISRKWKWGLQITPGISSLVNQAFSFSANKSADFAGAPPVGVPVPPATPSNRKSGFAFQVGGFAQKKIAAKTELSLGLQYSYYSDRIQVGDIRLLNQSSSQPQPLFGVSPVYRAANPNISFTNRYHFLELPVNFLFQLNKNSAKPFYLDLGINAGQMISSNALAYDTAFGGIYINGKNQFNKTQFSLSSGLLWTISSKKIQWSVGPVINVHFTRLLKNPFEGDKYLLMPGIRTKIILPGRK